MIRFREDCLLGAATAAHQGKGKEACFSWESCDNKGKEMIHHD